MVALSIKEIAEAIGAKVVFGTSDEIIDNVSTNSKEFTMGGHGLFVPIIGEKVDGHNYIGDALEHGAIACLTSRELPYHNQMTYLKVENTLEALQALGAYYRNKFSIPVIGITGSVGKTTTKEMVSKALETKFRVLKTEGNMNSQVGLPLMMLKLMPEHEIAVIEMGMSEEGEMERLAKIARPSTAIITNIGVSHIAQLKTKENIRKAKLNIVNEFDQNSVLFLCGNDPLLQEVLEQKEIDATQASTEKLKQCKLVSFGVAQKTLTQQFDYMATDILFSEETTRFQLIDASTDQSATDQETDTIELAVLGMHNVVNGLVALAVAKEFGIEPAVAKAGLLSYQPIAMRGQITAIGGIKVIDDSYNASPDSMKSGIGVLKALTGIKRRIAVLADVKELGEISQQSHYEVGEFLVKEPVDTVITIGEEAAHIGRAIRDYGSQIETHSFYNNEEALTFLINYLKEEDGILIKGSRGMRTDEIISGLKKHMH